MLRSDLERLQRKRDELLAEIGELTAVQARLQAAQGVFAAQGAGAPQGSRTAQPPPAPDDPRREDGTPRGPPPPYRISHSGPWVDYWAFALALVRPGLWTPIEHVSALAAYISGASGSLGSVEAVAEVRRGAAPGEVFVRPGPACLCAVFPPDFDCLEGEGLRRAVELSYISIPSLISGWIVGRHGSHLEAICRPGRARAPLVRLSSLRDIINPQPGYSRIEMNPLCLDGLTGAGFRAYLVQVIARLRSRYVAAAHILFDQAREGGRTAPACLGEGWFPV